MKKNLHTCIFLHVLACGFLAAGLFCSGCGIISLLGTPTRHEKRVPAEYELGKHRNSKILVLVHQPGWLDAQTNLRYYLTEAINKKLVEKIKIPATQLVAYGELSDFRSRQADFSLLSPIEVGSALGADMVLFITIDGYELRRMAETNYYKGFLGAHSSLYAVNSGQKLWPESARSKRGIVGFEVESRGQQAGVERLANGLAHCTVRYFYDCREDSFKITDDRSDIGWGG